MSESISSDSSQHVQRFVRHVPKVLSQQVLALLIAKFTTDAPAAELAIEPDAPPALGPVPSIARFQGALLFVDISGFTVLSQRLPVDELRVHINGYFKKILDIIYDFGGDVVKFAGDALYAVWKVGNGGDMRSSTASALKCGVHIISTCSKHKIQIGGKHRGSSQISSILLSSSEGLTDGSDFVGEENHSSNFASAAAAGFAELDVHAGLAIGQMAGIDVGKLDRWEYFIIGPPLQEVAVAESEAEKGEFVISAKTHDILCGPANGKAQVGVPLPCRCTMTPSGSFKIDMQQSCHHEFDPIAHPEEEKDELDYDFELLDLVLKDAHCGFDSAKQHIFRLYKAIVANRECSLKVVASKTSSKHFGEDVNDSEGEAVYSYFLQWIETCLTDDLWRHMHEAVRSDYTLHNWSRVGTLENYLVNGGENGRSSKRTSNSSTSSDEASRRQSAQSSDSGSVSYERKRKSLTGRVDVLRERRQAQNERSRLKDSSLVGELRNVIVMFISIHAAVSGLLIEESGGAKTADCAFGAFDFLPPTPAEQSADQTLLRTYQNCMECIVEALKSKGGQLRQFIVDDKGTVSIGTFGLRGSVNHDNAAAAIEAAQMIIGGLQEHGITAAIGITSGKAYCGLVGSLRRHEYAVMGPSTNLSARLMASAKPGQIICDVNIRKGDRLHQYRALGEVKAKGYAQPVPTFRPVFARGSVFGGGLALQKQISGLQDKAQPSTSALPVLSREATDGMGAPLSTQKPKNSIVVGREDIQRDMVRFLLRPMLEGTDTWEKLNNASCAADDGPCLMTFMQTEPVNLRLDFLTRLAILEGPSGVGKSALLEMYYEKMKGFSERGLINAVHLRGDTSSFNTVDPFRGWKIIIRSVLGFFADLSVEQKEGNAKSAGSAQVAAGKLASSLAKSVAKWTKGLNFIKPRLSEEQQQLLPLLTSMSIIPGLAGNEATAALSGAQRITKMTSLLFAILQLLPVLTSKVVTLLFDDAQFLDASSWELLQQLWMSGKGFVLLLTFAGKVENTISHPLAESLGGVCSADTFAICERLFRMDVPELAPEPTLALIEHIFATEGFTVEDERFHERVHSITGGNPLYIYELSRAILDKILASNPDLAAEGSGKTRKSVISKSDTGALLKDFHAARVEEVIFYRFDKLPVQSQLLLKMASVACIDGAPFSVPMLMAMLAGDDAINEAIMAFRQALFAELSAEDMVLNELRKILAKDEFLRIVPMSRRTSISQDPSEHSEAEASFPEELKMWESQGYSSSELLTMTFEFKIVLECKTIYGLMLEDQREAIHDRVATYLEGENAQKRERGLSSPHESFEEGFHWEKANVWSAAMGCYFRSAMQLDELGAYQESFQRLTSAYRMLNELKKDASIAEDADGSSRNYTLADVIAAVRRLMDSPSSPRDDVSVDAEVDLEIERQFGLSKADVARIFGGDSKLLDLGLQVILRLAQASLTLINNPAVISRLYEDALLMIMLTCDGGSGGSAPTTPGGTAPVPFRLEDPQIVFPILAGIATLYRTQRLKDDAEHSNEATMYRFISSVAGSSPIYFVHRLQGMCYMHSLCSELLDFDRCRALAREVKQIYKPAEHSAALIKWYGNDRVLFTLAREITFAKLRGEKYESDQALEEVLALTPAIQHVHSRGVNAFAMCSALHLAGRMKDAEKVFMSYYELEQSRTTYSFFRDINPLYVEYFRLRNELEAGHTVPVGQLSDLQERIFQKKFLIRGEGRPLPFDAVNSMTIGVENVSAEVLQMVAAQWLLSLSSNSSESDSAAWDRIYELLEVALEYIGLAASVSHQVNRLIFNHVQTCLTQASIAHSMWLLAQRAGGGSRGAQQEELRTQVEAALVQVVESGQTFRLPLVILQATAYARRFGCGLGGKEESDLQAKSWEGIIQLNGGVSAAEVRLDMMHCLPLF